MARFLFVTWGGAGNEVPAIGLAAELAGRGHMVTVAGHAGQRARFERLGFAFRVLPRAQRVWPATPPRDWMSALVDAVWACPEHLWDVPELVAAEQCDVLVVDCFMFGALSAAERLPAPTVALAFSPPGALAPPASAMERLTLDRLNAVRAGAGLAPVAALWDVWRSTTTLCTSIPELDPDAERLPEEFQFVGPVFEPQPPSGWQWPWQQEDDRPLALVSFSTGRSWDQRSRIRRTVAALGGGTYRVLVTTGRTDIEGDLGSRDVALASFLPHAEVLPSAAVTVTHAGHGTVSVSLAHGVPIVALPNPAADQPALAAQLARQGAGLALDGETASPDEIGHAVHTVLADASYAANARRLSQVITGAPGSVGAADQLDALVPSRVKRSETAGRPGE